jgi:hypothetical protein
MPRNVHTQCCTLGIIAAIVSLFQGCATRDLSGWVSPGAILQVESTSEVEKEFQSAFAGYRNRNNRFLLREISTSSSRFCFVIAYPYRGRNAFVVYCLEEVTSEMWYLRAIIPIIESRVATVQFVVDGSWVNVLNDEEVVFRIDSTTSSMGERSKHQH